MSAPQDVVFFNYKVSGVLSGPIRTKIKEMSKAEHFDSGDIRAVVDAKSASDYRRDNFSGLSSESCIFGIEIFNDRVYTSSVSSVVSTISIDSETIFLFNPGNMYSRILFGPSNITILGERSLLDSQYNFFVQDFRPYVTFLGSRYDSILWKANVAIPLGFKQNFWLNNSDQRVFKNFKDTKFRLGGKAPRSLMDSIYLDIMSLFPYGLSFYATGDRVPLIQNMNEASVFSIDSAIEESFNDHVYACEFNASISVKKEENNLYSPPFELVSLGVDLSNMTTLMSKTVLYSSVDGLYSSNMVMIQVTADSDDYVIEDILPLYGVTVYPRVTVYDDEDQKENSFGFLQPMASFNALKDTASLFSGETRVVIPAIIEMDTGGFTASMLRVTIWENELLPEKVGGMLAGPAEFLLGIFSPDNRFGLNRFLYLDDTTERENDRNIPWFSKGGDLFKIRDWNFYDLSTERALLSVFKISGFSSRGLVQDWSTWKIEDSRLEIGVPEIREHLSILETDTGKEIIFNRGDTHSSIISVRSEYLSNEEKGLFYSPSKEKLLLAEAFVSEMPAFDSGSLERKASILLSSRYAKYTKILENIIAGVIYDQQMIDKMSDYLNSDEATEATEYFRNVGFNPYIVSDIALNKDLELASLNVFSGPEVITHSGSTAIAKTEVNTPLNTLVSNVIRTKLVSVSSSKAPLITVFRNKTLEESRFIEMMDACGLGGKCSMVFIGGINLSHINFGSRALLVVEMTKAIETSLPQEHILIPDALVKRWNLGISLMIDFRELDVYVSQTGATVSTDVLRSNLFDLRLVIEDEPYKRMFVNHIRSVLRVSISTEQNTQSFIQGKSYFSMTTSSIVHGLIGYGNIKLEGDNTGEVTASSSRFQVLRNDSAVSSVVSDFKVMVHVTKPIFESRTGVYGAAGRMTVNAKIKSASGFIHKDFAWLKTFFPTRIDKACITSRIMDFNISEEDKYKNFYIPFVYVDDVADTGESIPGKPGQPDVSEKPLKEFDSPPSRKSIPTFGFECGRMSYLDFQRFNHIYTESAGILFGGISIEKKELINSGYIRAVVSPVITQGKKIENADIFQRSLVDLGVSYLDDVEMVSNWNMEEFKLEVDDFQNGVDPADLKRFGEVTAQGITNILQTIGDDLVMDEQMKKLSFFPEFEDRPAEYDDGLDTSLKIEQYLVVTEEEVIDV